MQRRAGFSRACTCARARAYRCVSVCVSPSPLILATSKGFIEGFSLFIYFLRLGSAFGRKCWRARWMMSALPPRDSGSACKSRLIQPRQYDFVRTGPGLGAPHIHAESARQGGAQRTCTDHRVDTDAM